MSLPICAATFKFSANGLLLLSRTERRTFVAFLMQDHSTRRVYRLYDFTKSQQITPGHYYCVSGRVNSAATLPGHRVGQDGHQTRSAFYTPAAADDAGGSLDEVKICVAGKN
jgi:hypothetical protein